MERGDTIIEVLLAITVFSLVAFGAISIMNQGTNAAQRALEITLVRQQLDAQAEAIRATQQAAAATGSTTDWADIAQGDSGHFAVTTACPKNTEIPPGSFFMNPKNATRSTTGAFKNLASASDLPYAKVVDEAGVFNSYGIWVERKVDGSNPALKKLYTFSIFACWDGAGLNTPMTISTVVRLYDPR